MKYQFVLIYFLLLTASAGFAAQFNKSPEKEYFQDANARNEFRNVVRTAQQNFSESAHEHVAFEFEQNTNKIIRSHYFKEQQDWEFFGGGSTFVKKFTKPASYLNFILKRYPDLFPKE